MNPTVMELVKGRLAMLGFGGLFNVGGGCGCKLGDLSPGNCMEENCEAGYLRGFPDHKCDGGEGTDCSCDGDCEWHIQRERPPDPPKTATEAVPL